MQIWSSSSSAARITRKYEAAFAESFVAFIYSRAPVLCEASVQLPLLGRRESCHVNFPSHAQCTEGFPLHAPSVPEP